MYHNVIGILYYNNFCPKLNTPCYNKHYDETFSGIRLQDLMYRTLRGITQQTFHGITDTTCDVSYN